MNVSGVSIGVWLSEMEHSLAWLAPQDCCRVLSLLQGCMHHPYISVVDVSLLRTLKWWFIKLAGMLSFSIKFDRIFQNLWSFSAIHSWLSTGILGPVRMLCRNYGKVFNMHFYLWQCQVPPTVWLGWGFRKYFWASFNFHARFPNCFWNHIVYSVLRAISPYLYYHTTQTHREGTVVREKLLQTLNAYVFSLIN